MNTAIETEMRGTWDWRLVFNLLLECVVSRFFYDVNV